MNESKNIENIVDAFIALRDVPDEAVADMIKPARKKAVDESLTEGKSFNIYGNYLNNIDEIKDFFDDKVDGQKETELRVIDPDANAVNHLKDPESYIGQAIINCNRCKANVFIDMDKLSPDENDDDLYNVDDECPYCHATAAGYSLIGQVGKVEEETLEEDVEEETSEEESIEEPMEETEEESTEEETPEEESEGTSEEEGEEEVAFENTEEESEEEIETGEPEEEEAEEEEEVETFEPEEEEENGMETSESEEELEEIEQEVTTKDGKKLTLKLKTKKLGDVYEEDFSADHDREEVNEALADEMTLDTGDTTWGEKAWKLGQIMLHMNNEDAYFGGWLYIWPDGETYEECLSDFNSEDEYEDLRNSFNRHYRAYHNDGLFEAPQEVEEWAHEIDRELGLKPIENLHRHHESFPTVDEFEKFNSISEFFKRVNHPERINKVVIAQKDYDAYDDGVYPLFEGVSDDMSAETLNCKVDCFDVGNGYLTCNIDCADTDNNDNLKSFLSRYCDEDSDKVVLWDADSSDECFQGCKQDAIKNYGDCAFKCIEAPKVLIIRLDDATIEPECDNCPKSNDEDKLINDIYKANGLDPFNKEDPTTNEFWISESIKHKDELTSIYEQFIKPIENKQLTEQFNKITNFKEAKIDLREKRNSAAKSLIKENLENLDRDELQNLVDSDWEDAVRDLSLNSPVDDFVNYFDREIDPSISSYDPSTLKTIVNNKLIRSKINKSRKDSKPIDEFEDVEDEEVVESYSSIEENQSFKTRKELAAAISECRKNNRPYTIRRSLKEGYRYDLIPNDNPDDWKADDLDAKSADYEEEQRAMKELAAEEIDEDVDGELIEIIDDDELEVAVDEHPVVMSEIDQAIMAKITRIAQDIQEAIKVNYDIDVNPGLIVADILQDLRLISHEVRPEDLRKNGINKLTIDMFRSYEATMEFIDALMSAFTGRTIESTPERRLTQAIASLDSPAFEREAIFKGIQSDAFLEAARAGAVPYITSSVTRQLPPAEDIDEYYPDDHKGLQEETALIEFPTEQFDSDMNDYFDTVYADKVVYKTKSGAADRKGNIVLEGVLSILSDTADEEGRKDLDVTFTLTPVDECIKESFDKSKLQEKLGKMTYRVTNNLSEEIFEFKA